MQATGHKALQEMNNTAAAQVNDFTKNTKEKPLPLPSNYAKSFSRVQAILKAYIMAGEPKSVIFTFIKTDGSKPLLIDVVEDKDEFLGQITSMLFNHVIQGTGDDEAVLDFIFQDDGLSSVYINVISGEMLDFLSIKGQLIPTITHTMYDLSELASLYNIDPNESLADVKLKVAQSLDKKDNVTYYDLDHDHLECLVERQSQA